MTPGVGMGGHRDLMAADAFARGDRLRAELFVAKANQYADEAAALAEAKPSCNSNSAPRQKRQVN